MPMARVSRTAKTKTFRASIDQVRLKFNSEGVAERDVEPGKHRLSWAAFGSMGQKYSIEILQPANTSCKHEAVLDEDGFDFGDCDFDVKAG